MIFLYWHTITYMLNVHFIILPIKIPHFFEWSITCTSCSWACLVFLCFFKIFISWTKSETIEPLTTVCVTLEMVANKKTNKNCVKIIKRRASLRLLLEPRKTRFGYDMYKIRQEESSVVKISILKKTPKNGLI